MYALVYYIEQSTNLSISKHCNNKTLSFIENPCSIIDFETHKLQRENTNMEIGRAYEKL